MAHNFIVRSPFAFNDRRNNNLVNDKSCTGKLRDNRDEGWVMLRRARKVEAATVHALLWGAKNAIPLTKVFYTKPYRRWVEDRCKEHVVWCVVQKATIIGAMVMQENEIFYLVVAPEHQRKGVGRKLVRKAKAVCRGHSVRAKIALTNVAVAGLLATEGFRNEGIVPGATANWMRYSWYPC